MADEQFTTAAALQERARQEIAIEWEQWNASLPSDAPRWRLGRAWGQDSDTLKLESRFPEATASRLRAFGHEIEMLGAYDESMGHAGMLVRHANGTLEGGSDPRSDGCVAAF